MHLNLDGVFTAITAVAGGSAVIADSAGALPGAAATGLFFTVLIGFATIMAHQLLGTVKETNKNVIELMTITTGAGGLVTRVAGLEDRELDRLQHAADENGALRERAVTPHR